MLCRQSTGTVWPAPDQATRPLSPDMDSSLGILQEESVLIFPDTATWEAEPGGEPRSPLSY